MGWREVKAKYSFRRFIVDYALLAERANGSALELRARVQGGTVAEFHLDCHNCLVFPETCQTV